jgi:hypothetical protein
MGGGLLQLVAYGAQDVYLTGNPQITFFKVVYRRHTNFALESIQQTFNGSVGYNQRVTSTISRNGDLISRTYLVVNTSADDCCPYYGLRLVKYAEVEIGGQKIDKHYGEWMYIWNELSLPVGKKDAYFNMVGGSGMDLSDRKLYIPLEFWFCRNVGLALPLIGLQYHEVKIVIQFAADTECGTGDTAVSNNTFNASLWVDYVYLDTDERRKFAQSSHEYLIEQLQFTGKESAAAKIKLNFNHPVKELVWTTQDNTVNNDNWFNFGSVATSVISAGTSTCSDYATLTSTIGPSQTATKNLTKSAKLSLNGNDRFATRDGKYFNIIQPFQHHENVPNNVGINVYSFALKPEEHQPSGTLNMSRIDTANLSLEYETATFTDKSVSIYAVNYNVLRILSGMGGIAYSN